MNPQEDESHRSEEFYTHNGDKNDGKNRKTNPKPELFDSAVISIYGHNGGVSIVFRNMANRLKERREEAEPSG